MSVLSNVIERTIGILKRRFKVLQTPIELRSLSYQNILIYSLVALHNFIRMESPTADNDIEREQIAEERAKAARVIRELAVDPLAPVASDDAASEAHRETVARLLWHNYRLELAARNLAPGDVDEPILED